MKLISRSPKDPQQQVSNRNNYVAWCLVQLTLLLLVIRKVEKTTGLMWKDISNGPRCIKTKSGTDESSNCTFLSTFKLLLRRWWNVCHCFHHWCVLNDFTRAKSFSVALVIVKQTWLEGSPGASAHYKTFAMICRSRTNVFDLRLKPSSQYRICICARQDGSSIPAVFTSKWVVPDTTTFLTLICL